MVRDVVSILIDNIADSKLLSSLTVEYPNPANPKRRLVSRNCNPVDFARKVRSYIVSWTSGSSEKNT